MFLLRNYLQRMPPAKFKIPCFSFALPILAFCFLAGCGQGEFSDVEPLPIENYVKKPGDFLGNRYVLRAQIDEQLKWEKGIGRVIAVLDQTSTIRLPVFVPEGVSDNLHVGQRYEMKAIIEQGGLINVEALRKY